MRRVVIDTNVLIKALFVGGSKQDSVFGAFIEGELQVCYSLEMLEEFIRVVGYPKIVKSFGVKAEEFGLMVRKIRRDGVVFVPHKTDLCRDIKDNMVLGTAMAAAKLGPVSLITEDEDLLELKGKVERVEIVTPGEFLKKMFKLR